MTNSSGNGTTHDDFVTLFIQATQNYESPTSFWRWSAYATIAAVLRNNCWHNWGSSNKIYANIYVILLADSAKFRKDAGLKLAGDLLNEVAHTKVISGRASWQGILDELSMDIGNKKTGIPLKGGSCIILAPELSAFFVADPQLIPMITDGYDFKEEMQYTLRGGKTLIKNRCITMLAASNETLLKEVYDVRALYGGLLRRTFLIKPDEVRGANALMDENIQVNETHRKGLIQALNKIKTLNGEITKENAAKDLYKKWYNDLYNKYDEQDRTGFLHGMHALVFKLAIIIAASNYSLHITEPIMAEAILQVTALKDNYREYSMSSGKNPHANMSALILTQMWAANGSALKRREILIKYWNEISSEDLDKIMLTLEGANLIKGTAVNNEPAYELTQRAKDEFLANAKTNQKVN